jgi:hypothetical protein
MASASPTSEPHKAPRNLSTRASIATAPTTPGLIRRMRVVAGSCVVVRGVWRERERTWAEGGAGEVLLEKERRLQLLWRRVEELGCLWVRCAGWGGCLTGRERRSKQSTTTYTKKICSWRHHHDSFFASFSSFFLHFWCTSFMPIHDRKLLLLFFFF